MDDRDRQRPQLVLIRFSGDISIKAHATRSQFMRRLISNLGDALAGSGPEASLRVSHDRIFAELPAGGEISALARVFGVQSVSPVELRAGTGLAEIVEAGRERFGERVRGRRFAVRARRVGSRERIATRARDVERELGAALLPDAAGVDLGNPEITVHVELLEKETYLFAERIDAPGGLPLGVGGNALALVSGGFDSAVAAWHLLKRGLSLDYVFCNLGGATHLQGVLRVAKVLADRWSYGDRPRLHSLDFEPLVAEIRRCTTRRYWQVLLKRSMLRAAEAIARQRAVPALVTGEAVGQVSSQTLQNLAVISQATPHLILRPLVGSNKDEIIATAERIGTFELSKVVGEYCDLVPRRPATAATLDAILAEEARMDASLVDQVVASRSVIDLRGFDLEKLDLPGTWIERVPEGALLLDLRSKAEFDGWHHPDAVRMDFAQAVRAYPSFDRGATYVLYCEFGLKSAHLAEMMRRQGFEAFNFRGGVRALRKAVSSDERERDP